MSASSILSRLRHKGQITEAEYRKLMDIKNGERHMRRVIEDIRAEIEELDRYYDNDYFSVNNCPMFKCNEVLQIIDKHIKG